MRAYIWAGGIAAALFLAAALWDRFVSEAPLWVVSVIGFALVAIIVAMALVLDPVYVRWWGPRSTTLSSALILALAGAIIGGAGALLVRYIAKERAAAGVSNLVRAPVISVHAYVQLGNRPTPQPVPDLILLQTRPSHVCGDADPEIRIIWKDERLDGR
jgi:hypothetical protein